MQGGGIGGHTGCTRPIEAAELLYQYGVYTYLSGYFFDRQFRYADFTIDAFHDWPPWRGIYCRQVCAGGNWV